MRSGACLLLVAAAGCRQVFGLHELHDTRDDGGGDGNGPVGDGRHGDGAHGDGPLGDGGGGGGGGDAGLYTSGTYTFDAVADTYLSFAARTNNYGVAPTL